MQGSISIVYIYIYVCIYVYITVYLCILYIYVYRHTSGVQKFMLVNHAQTTLEGQLRLELPSPIFVAGVGRSIIAPF